jgi:hypothetical protein
VAAATVSGSRAVFEPDRAVWFEVALVLVA